jgi:hypothetical protein
VSTSEHITGGEIPWTEFEEEDDEIFHQVFNTKIFLVQIPAEVESSQL